MLRGVGVGRVGICAGRALWWLYTNGSLLKAGREKDTAHKWVRCLEHYCYCSRLTLDLVFLPRTCYIITRRVTFIDSAAQPTLQQSRQTDPHTEGGSGKKADYSFEAGALLITSTFRSV